MIESLMSNMEATIHGNPWLALVAVFSEAR